MRSEGAGPGTGLMVVVSMGNVCDFLLLFFHRLGRIQYNAM